MRFKEYKIIHVVESGLGAIFFGSSSLPIKKMETILNKEAVDGWQVVFQVVEKRRFWLFWERDAVIITLGR